MAVSPMLTNHTRRTLNGHSLIRMAGEHLEESQRLYYLRVDWLNLNMHGLDQLETKVSMTWEALRNQILKKESGIVQSTCMLHPTLIRRKAHKRVKPRLPVKDRSDLESIDQQGDEDSSCIAGSRGRLEEECSEEEALSGTSDSLPVIRVTRGRDQKGTNTTIRVPLRKRAGTGGKEKKRSGFH